MVGWGKEGIGKDLEIRRKAEVGDKKLEYRIFVRVMNVIDGRRGRAVANRDDGKRDARNGEVIVENRGLVLGE
jgi:hypothetical protein